MSCGFGAHEHAVHVDMERKVCRGCEGPIVWGETVKGKRAPFDPDTLRNHWITCPEKDSMRTKFPRKGARA